MMLDVVWDMETSDPDDFLTLLFLLGHPAINLKAITIVPGTTQQVGVVRQALSWFDRDIPIGVHNLAYEKPSVSDWHYEAFGEIEPSSEALSASDLLLESCDANTTLIVGGPLTNVATAIRMGEEQNHPLEVGRFFIQGGFAGEGVVPEHLQLERFKGLVTCPTHNLIKNKKATHRVLEFTNTSGKYFVSKNVCHRVYYDRTMHEQIADVKYEQQALQRIWQGMDVYLKHYPEGKLLHDPLTACCAIDHTIGTWREVELFREGSEWGARLLSGSNTWIIIDYNHEKFLKAFMLV